MSTDIHAFVDDQFILIDGPRLVCVCVCLYEGGLGPGAADAHI